MAVLQGAAVLFSTWWRALSPLDLAVQVCIQAVLPLLCSLGLVASLGSPLGMCLTPRKHHCVGKRSSCRSPGALTSASNTSAYLCLNVLHSSLGTQGFLCLLLSHRAHSGLTAAFLCIAEFFQVPRRCQSEQWECLWASRELSCLVLFCTSKR